MVVGHDKRGRVVHTKHVAHMLSFGICYQAEKGILLLCSTYDVKHE